MSVCLAGIAFRYFSHSLLPSFFKSFLIAHYFLLDMRVKSNYACSKYSTLDLKLEAKQRVNLFICTFTLLVLVYAFVVSLFFDFQLEQEECAGMYALTVIIKPIFRFIDL